MKSSGKNSYKGSEPYPAVGIAFKHIISIVLAFAVMVVSPLILMFFTLFFDYTPCSYSIKTTVIFILSLLLVTTPCYVICRLNFRSVWYVPLIVNLGTIFIIIGILSNYWSANGKIILLAVTILLAILLSILGSVKGKLVSQDHKEPEG